MFVDGWFGLKRKPYGHSGWFRLTASLTGCRKATACIAK